MFFSFINMLGFPNLAENFKKTAKNNIYIANGQLIESQYFLDGEPSSFTYILGSSNSVEHLMSDSLMIISESQDTFVKQLSHFLCNAYCKFIDPFKKSFGDIKDVKIEKNSRYNLFDEDVPAFPIMYKGGVTFKSAETLNDFDDNEIIVVNKENYNVLESGRDLETYSSYDRKTCIAVDKKYLEAVKFEIEGKGPRIFCDKKFYDSLSEEGRKYVKPADDIINESGTIYEIVWTYYLCKDYILTPHNSPGYCNTEPYKDHLVSAYGVLLTTANNLYSYSRVLECKNRVNKEKEKYISTHYKKLILLIRQGMLLYLENHNLDWRSKFEDIFSENVSPELTKSFIN